MYTHTRCCRRAEDDSSFILQFGILYLNEANYLSMIAPRNPLSWGRRPYSCNLATASVFYAAMASKCTGTRRCRRFLGTRSSWHLELCFRIRVNLGVWVFRRAGYLLPVVQRHRQYFTPGCQILECSYPSLLPNRGRLVLESCPRPCHASVFGLFVWCFNLLIVHVRQLAEISIILVNHPLGRQT